MATRPIGAEKSADKVIEVVFALDPAGVAYASGDLLADVVQLTDVAFQEPEGSSTVLYSVVVVDEDDQGQNLTFVFHDSNPGSIGTLNAVPIISDTAARSCCGTAAVTSWEDIGGAQIGTVSSVNILMTPDNGRDLWVWALSKGTGTYASKRLMAKFGFIRR